MDYEQLKAFTNNEIEPYLHYIEMWQCIMALGIKPFKDGNQWSFLYGDNIQEGIYGFGSTIDEVAWYVGSKIHPVKTKNANELGIYDMSGNVLEWCQDWYGKYSSNAQTNPTGPSSGTSRVCRGGSWSYGAGGCRSARRERYSPGDRNYYLGLRLVLSE